MSENQTQKFEVKFKPRFGDIKIHWTGNLEDPKELFSLINDSMEEWLEADRPSIWIKLHGKDLDFLNQFIDFGFTMHRLKKGNIIVLNKWIRKGSKTLPPGPFGYYGVGGMCINDEGKVLCVRENYKTGPGPWKLPGGLYDLEKDRKFSDTAIREVFEETGVRAKFDHLVNTRLVHSSAMFHAPDLYSIVRLTPLTTEIHFDPVEIADAQWVDLDVLAANPYPMLGLAVEAEKRGDKGFDEKEANVYHPHSIYLRKFDDEEENQ